MQANNPANVKNLAKKFETGLTGKDQTEKKVTQPDRKVNLDFKDTYHDARWNFADKYKPEEHVAERDRNEYSSSENSQILNHANVVGIPERERSQYSSGNNHDLLEMANHNETNVNDKNKIIDS